MAFEKFKNILGGSEPEDETNETPDEEFYTSSREEYSEQNGTAGSKMMLLEPRAYSESQQIADYLKGRNAVVVNLKRVTPDQAKQLNIRDAVTSGPFLIVNGQSSRVIGNGGWGTAPRTAIGQRKDGVVLLLVIDGRKVGRAGAQMNDLIEIMERYGAYNAAALDGGTSSVMIENYKIINDPINSDGVHKTRPVATAWGLILDDSSSSTSNSQTKAKNNTTNGGRK